MKILKSLKCQNIPYGLFSYSVTVENIHSKLERTVSFGESPLECQVSICGLVLVAQPHLTLQPHGLQPARLLCPWGSPDKNTGVGSHALLQSIFPTQELNLSLLPLLHWQVDSLPLCHVGSPQIMPLKLPLCFSAFMQSLHFFLDYLCLVKQVCSFLASQNE